MDDTHETVSLVDFGVLGALSPTKEKILNAAIDMFSAQGFSAVSVRDITREVGIKESSLYNHFRNKDEILETILVLFRAGYQLLTPSTAQLDDVLAKMGPEQFLRYGKKRYMDLVNDAVMGKIWRIMNIEQYRNARARDMFLGDVIQGTLAFLEQAFAKMIHLGHIKPLDPALLAAEYQYPVFAMATEYNMLKFDNMDTTQIERKLENHVEFFLKAIQR